MKRLFDIIFAFISIIFLFPFLLIILIIVGIDSKGKPIYIQTRLTKNRKQFKLYKFRTMIINKESKQSFKDNLCFKDKDDYRITKLGKILRKLSIDELPQLINIIKGDMSLIGPRPCMLEEEKYFNDSHFKYKAGLTGLTQLYRNKKLTIEELNKLDESYSPKKDDIKIFFKTFLVLFKGK